MTGACLFAIMPHCLGGVRLRAGAGPVRDRWLELLASLLDSDQPMRRIHPNIGDPELLGGLDLTATIESGRTVCSRGVLASADNGVLVLAMAERCSSQLAARIAAALDSGAALVQREAGSGTKRAAFGLVALDEGEADEAPPAALLERFSLDLDLTLVSIGQLSACSFTFDDVAAARRAAANTQISAEVMEAIAATALSLGVMPLRWSLLACLLARASAALFGRGEVDPADAALAVRLVLAPRATVAPKSEPEPMANDQNTAPPEPPQSEPLDAESAASSESTSDPSDSAEDTSPLSEQLLEAAVAAIPEDLLQRLMGDASTRSNMSKGQSGNNTLNATHGRPLASVQRSLKGNSRSI